MSCHVVSLLFLFFLAPSPPVLEFVNSTSFSIYMMWRPPANSNGIIRRYLIEYMAANDVTHVDVDGPALDFTINGLRPFTRYILKVAAFTVALGQYSNEKIQMTMESSKY